MIDGGFTQVTLTWLPVKGENTPVEPGSKHVCKPMEYRNMRRKAPSELRRDKARREAYVKGVQHQKSGNENNAGTVKQKINVGKQINGAVASTPRITRSRSRVENVIEGPRANDSVCDSFIISPEKVSELSSELMSDSSADPLVCLPVSMVTTNPTETIYR